MFSGECHFFYSKKLEQEKKRVVELGHAPKEALFISRVVDEDGFIMTFNFISESLRDVCPMAKRLGDVEYITTADTGCIIKNGYPSLKALYRLNMSAISSPSKKRLADDNIFFFFSEKLSNYLNDQNTYDVVDIDGCVMRYNFCSTRPDDFLKIFSSEFDDFVLLTKTSAFSIIINGEPTSTARDRVDFVSEHLGYLTNADIKINNIDKLKSVIKKSISK